MYSKIQPISPTTRSDDVFNDRKLRQIFSVILRLPRDVKALKKDPFSMRYPHKTYSRSFQIYPLWGAFSKRQKRTKMYALFRKVSYALPYSLSQNSGLIFPKAQHNIFVHTIKVFSPCTLPRGRILFNAFFPSSTFND